MRLGIPIARGRISPLLDTAARLLVLTCHDHVETGRNEVVLPPAAPSAMAVALAELKLDLLLCGAASEELLSALRQHGVQVHPRLCGELPAVLQAFCENRLEQKEFLIPGCGSLIDSPAHRTPVRSRPRALATESRSEAPRRRTARNRV